jgi:hypothetical protein
MGKMADAAGFAAAQGLRLNGQALVLVGHEVAPFAEMSAELAEEQFDQYITATT